MFTTAGYESLQLQGSCIIIEKKKYYWKEKDYKKKTWAISVIRVNLLLTISVQNHAFRTCFQNKKTEADEVARWAPLPLSAKKWNACTGHQYKTNVHQLWLCSRD